MTNINILYVIPSLEVGGTEKSLLTLITHLLKDEYEIHICCLKNSDSFIALTIIEKGYEVFNLSMKSFLDVPKAIKNLGVYIEDNRIDIVSAYLFYAHVISYFAVRRTLRRPKLIYNHRTTIVYPLQTLFNRLCSPDQHVCNCDAAKDVLFG